MALWLWLGMAWAGWNEDRQADYDRFVRDARLPDDAAFGAVLSQADGESIAGIASQDPTCPPVGAGVQGYERRCAAITGSKSAKACASLAALAAVQVRMGGLDRGEDTSWQFELRCGSGPEALLAMAGVRARRANDAWADGRVEVTVTYLTGAPVFTKTLGSLPQIPFSPKGQERHDTLQSVNRSVELIAPVTEALDGLRIALTGDPAGLTVALAKAKVAVQPALLASLSLKSAGAEGAARAFIASVGQLTEVTQEALNRFGDEARAANDWAPDAKLVECMLRLAELYETIQQAQVAHDLGGGEGADLVRRQTRVHANLEATRMMENMLSTTASVATTPSSLSPGPGRASLFLAGQQESWAALMRASRKVEDPVIGPFTAATVAYLAVLQSEHDAVSGAVGRAARGEITEAEMGALLGASFERIRAAQAPFAAAFNEVRPKVGL